MGNWLTRMGSARTIVGSAGNEEGENVKDIGALGAGSWKGDPVLSDVEGRVTFSAVCQRVGGVDPELTLIA